MDLKIRAVNCQRDKPLVRFQGNRCLECEEFDYHILQNEIQIVPKVKSQIGTGDFCLVQENVSSQWQRGKVVAKANETITVILIDQGPTVNVHATQIAPAGTELFILPPKIVNGVFSSILPIGERWTPKAVNYFGSLVGLRVKAYGKAVLPDGEIVLEVPCVISRAVEFRLVKYIDSKTFCFLADILHKQITDILHQDPSGLNRSHGLNNHLQSFNEILNHLRPELSVGTSQPIKISAALDFGCFFCHVVSWEEALSSLTSEMCFHYDSTKTKLESGADNMGLLCAAKRKDGIWRRGIIQRHLPSQAAQIWFLDYGSSEIIPSSCVQNLPLKFLSLPMMAIPCSLMHLNAKHVHHIQIMLFKQCLLGHEVIGRFEQFSSEKNLFYITLLTKDSELNCRLTSQRVPEFRSNIKFPSKTAPLTERASRETSKTHQMEIDSVHVGYVKYALDPSNFWIQTDDFRNEFSAMMESIGKIYNPRGTSERVIRDPKPGDLCCALYETDGRYYRALVTNVFHLEVTVYFLDFGNTETVPFYDVKTLRPEFSTLPALAMCCSLDCPRDDVWANSASEFFKQIVSGKALRFRVLAKQNQTYTVDACYHENAKRSNILAMMVEAGLAERWKIDRNQSLDVECSLTANKYGKKEEDVKQCNSCITNKSTELANSWLPHVQNQKAIPAKGGQASVCKTQPVDFKQYLFKPGEVIDVKCSHVNTPGDFWCQLLNKASGLESLMKSIQIYYSACNDLYENGQIACIVKYGNGRCYRAAIETISEKTADVFFVDYGKTDKVSTSDLRQIKPPFLLLEGQAFRCSLNCFNPPVRPRLTWTLGACRAFRSFLDSSVSEKLKCTINAQFSIGPNDLFNAVSLETPRKSACQYLSSQGHASFSLVSAPSITLHTFVYSDFNMKVGSLEHVYITCFYNTGKFYCHIARNYNVVQTLMEKVSAIGNRMIGLGRDQIKRMCIVKYFQEGRFYRAIANPVGPSSTCSAIFVDFGSRHMLREDELLSIPDEATDVLCEPMQAIKCSLSGLQDVVLTPEVRKWFNNNCLGKWLNAVVVDKDCYGQIALELYMEEVHVNQMIKELLAVYSPTDDLEKLENSSLLVSLPETYTIKPPTLDVDSLAEQTKECVVQGPVRLIN